MKKQKILLIDRNDESLNFFKNLFNNKYEINRTNNLETTLEVLFSDQRPQLILLDILIDDVVSYEVIKTLKNDARTSDIAILIIHNSKDQINIQECFETGAVGCITKPFYKSEVEAKIKNTLQLFHLRDSLSNALEERQRHLLAVERQLNAIDEHVLYVSLDLQYNIKDVSTAFMNLLHCNKESYIEKNEHCLSKAELGEKKFHEIGRAHV